MTGQIPVLHLRWFTPFGLWLAYLRLFAWQLRYFQRFVTYEEARAFKGFHWIPIRKTVLYIESEDGAVVFWRDPQLPHDEVERIRKYIRNVLWSKR